MSNYAWQGEVIKLNQKDYKKLTSTFPGLNINQELEVMDMVFQMEPPKKWYMAMMYKLRYQYDKLQKSTTRQRPIALDLTDRSWAK